MYTFVMAGGEKSIGKALPLVGFLSYLDSRTYDTKAVLLEKFLHYIFLIVQLSDLQEPFLVLWHFDYSASYI